MPGRAGGTAAGPEPLSVHAYSSPGTLPFVTFWVPSIRPRQESRIPSSPPGSPPFILRQAPLIPLGAPLQAPLHTLGTLHPPAQHLSYPSGHSSIHHALGALHLPTQASLIPIPLAHPFRLSSIHPALGTFHSQSQASHITLMRSFRYPSIHIPSDTLHPPLYVSCILRAPSSIHPPLNIHPRPPGIPHSSPSIPSQTLRAPPGCRRPWPAAPVNAISDRGRVSIGAR